MTRRVAIAGWYGSDNLGDELILRSLTEALRARGAEPVAISIDADRTQAAHQIEAVTHRNPSHHLALRRTLRDVDAITAAGGLIQSETSPWNVPFHASRLLAAEPRCTAATVGLGVGTVSGAPARILSRRALERCSTVVVRDHDSAARLRSLGLRDAVVGADPVMALTPETVEADESMCIILRPENRQGMGTAKRKAATSIPPDAQLWQIARSIDATATECSLVPRFVAMQASRDDPIHAEVAVRMAVDAEVVAPSVDDVLAAVGRSAIVVTMRYHGAVAALLHDRPTVVVDSSPKMVSLASEGGGWAPVLSTSQLRASTDLAAAVRDALQRHSRAADARSALNERLAVNERALDLLAYGR